MTAPPPRRMAGDHGPATRQPVSPLASALASAPVSPPCSAPESAPVPAWQLLVLAKAPVPGRVKTRLCPPFTPAQAAGLAAAALADTLATAASTPTFSRTLVLCGRYPAPPGWRTVPQRGDDLGERLANAYRDTATPRVASLLVGMDTPQLTPGTLTTAALALACPDMDAVLGLAEDGGWWTLGLRDPAHAAALAGVAMSTPRTGADTLAVLRARGLRVGLLATLRDVDTAEDARVVAGRCPPSSRFRRTALAGLRAAG